MKVQCPNCKASGQISDVKVPAEGLMLNCPRCKVPFSVKRDAASGWQSGDCLTMCPKCNYSTFTEETFDTCPKCGLVAREYHARLRNGQLREEQLREEQRLRQEEEQALRRHGIIRDDPAPQDKVAAVESAVPPSIQLVGWGVLVVALSLLLLGGKDRYSFTRLCSTGVIDPVTDEPRTKLSLFLEFGLLPAFATLFGLVTLVVGSQFLQLRSWARSALEYVTWLGLVFLACYELFGLVTWIRLSSSSPTLSYYLTGIVSTLGMLAIWLVPLLLLIRFLRGETVRKSVV